MMGHRQVEQISVLRVLARTTYSRRSPASVHRPLRRPSEVRRELTAFYSTMGRPSIDPELMIRMLIAGLLLRHSIGAAAMRGSPPQSGLSMVLSAWPRPGHVPDHSTFSKNRHGRFRESDLLRRVFETVLRRCIREGLVGGEAFAVDASLIKADANRQNGIEGEKGLPPEATGRAVEEYLAVLDDAAFGAATDVVPKFVSPADPAARWTGAHGGQAFFAYSTNYLIDADNADHRGCRSDDRDPAGRGPRRKTHDRTLDGTLRSGNPPASRGDSAYGSAEMLGWFLYEQGIEPHVTVFDKSARQDGTFSRDDFTYDHDGDVYYCPGGKMLTTTGSRINDGATLRYRASKYDCEGCRLKPRCCPKEPARYVPRSIYEGARDMARQIASSWGRPHRSTAAQES